MTQWSSCLLSLQATEQTRSSCGQVNVESTANCNQRLLEAQGTLSRRQFQELHTLLLETSDVFATDSSWVTQTRYGTPSIRVTTLPHKAAPLLYFYDSPGADGQDDRRHAEAGRSAMPGLWGFGPPDHRLPVGCGRGTARGHRGITDAASTATHYSFEGSHYPYNAPHGTMGGACKFTTSCYFRHICSHCNGEHWALVCPTRPR